MSFLVTALTFATLSSCEKHHQGNNYSSNLKSQFCNSSSGGSGLDATDPCNLDSAAEDKTDYAYQSPQDQMPNPKQLNIASSPFSGIPGVYEFTADMPIADIQSTIQQIYTKQMKNEFGSSHYAILFHPGTYTNLLAKVGYNTQVLGLGDHIDDTKIVGSIGTQDWPSSYCPVFWTHLGALNNFWRSLENVSIDPTNVTNDETGNEWFMQACDRTKPPTYNYPGDTGGGKIMRADPGNTEDQVKLLGMQGTNYWAVSQASPIRRAHIKDLSLAAKGWSSGGFMANVTADIARSNSQQQWFTRNTTLDTWQGQNWNMVFLNSQVKLYQKVDGTPANQSTYPFTIVNDEKIQTIEKPYLKVRAEDQKYVVVLPDLKNSTQAENPSSSPLDGTETTAFKVVTPTDSVDTINGYLNDDAIDGVVFAPGQYVFDAPLIICKPNKFLLGIGIPNFIPRGQHPLLKVMDVDNVRVAGIVFDAGAQTNKNNLVIIGDNINSKNASANHPKPAVLSDVFCRIGGRNYTGQAQNCVLIKSNDVIGDNLWLWRADHGQNAKSTGWTGNTGDSGLIVYGDRVNMFGLAVEHFQKYQTQWYGDDGKTIFYQSEMPYDAPISWKNDQNSETGYASYYVGPDVKTHTGYGLGIYSFFRDAPGLMVTNSIDVASISSDIQFKNLLNVWLNGSCQKNTPRQIDLLLGNGQSSGASKTVYDCDPSNANGITNIVNGVQGSAPLPGALSGGPTAAQGYPKTIMDSPKKLNLIMMSGWDAQPLIGGNNMTYLPKWSPKK